MSKRTKGMAVAVLAVLAAVIALYLAFAGRPQKINLDTYEVLGAVTAEETAKLVDQKGRVLVLVRDTGADKNPSVEGELKAFQGTLKRHAGLDVIVERIQVPPMQMMSTGGGLPTVQFFKALETHAKVDAVVLFFGFPPLTDLELASLKKTGVKTVVVSSFRPGYQRLLERQAINLAIVPRPDTSVPVPQTQRTLRERFNQEYILMTPGGSPERP